MQEKSRLRPCFCPDDAASIHIAAWNCETIGGVTCVVTRLVTTVGVRSQHPVCSAPHLAGTVLESSSGPSHVSWRPAWPLVGTCDRRGDQRSLWTDDGLRAPAHCGTLRRNLRTPDAVRRRFPMAPARRTQTSAVASWRPPWSTYMLHGFCQAPDISAQAGLRCKLASAGRRMERLGRCGAVRCDRATHTVLG